MKPLHLLVAAAFACGGMLLPAHAIDVPADSPERKPDLADVAEGTYFGDVTSDSQGSSKSAVTLIVTRIGIDLVRITSDYPRLPTVEVLLTQAMDKIINARGDTTFFLDRSPHPPRLDVSFGNEVSWAGEKR